MKVVRESSWVELSGLRLWEAAEVCGISEREDRQPGKTSASVQAWNYGDVSQLPYLFLHVFSLPFLPFSLPPFFLTSIFLLFPSLFSPLLPLLSSHLFSLSPFPPFFSPTPLFFPLFLFGTEIEPKALCIGNQVLYTSELLVLPLATFLDKTEQRLTKQQLPMVGGACPRLEEAEKEGLRYFFKCS